MNSNRLSRITVSGFLIFIAVSSGCDCGKNPAWEPTSYTIDIPAFFPPMDIPADNAMTEEGIKLGRLLFGKNHYLSITLYHVAAVMLQPLIFLILTNSAQVLMVL